MRNFAANSKVVNQDTYAESNRFSLMAKLRDYAVLVKFRLNFLVVLSAMSGYLFAPAGTFDSFKLWMLSLGGFLVTGASNGLNQVIEREYDKLMDRTKNRPMPRGAMSVTEGVAISLIMGIAGLYVLFEHVNFKSGLLALMALFIYVAIYTPMKRWSPWSVLVGAFPGAIPPLLGWVAATNEFGFIAGVLFFIQFMWQFPHFWAVAWVAYEDYKKAGYKLLPSSGGRNKWTSLQILLYTLVLIPVSLVPWMVMNPDVWAETPVSVGYIAFVVVAICNAGFYWFAYRLHLTNDLKDAKKLMFASFIYLPIVQFVYVIDKVTL